MSPSRIAGPTTSTEAVKRSLASRPAEIETAVDVLAAHSGETALRYGAWHGDWAPWNMANLADTLLNAGYLLPRLQAQVQGKLPALTGGFELVPAGLAERVGDYAALALLG